jgi:thiol-disulfide isomerase/thioredoxin
VITVYSREGCHLCDDALGVLRPLAAEFAVPVEVVDIEADDDLHRRFLERIPVVSLDGDELYDFFVDEEDLRSRLGNRLEGR